MAAARRGARRGARPAARRAAVCAALCAFAVVLLSAAPARAEIRRVTFPVRGMVCPLCTRGVEESIKRLPGVARVSADLSTGAVVVEAAEHQSLDIQQVRDRAAKAGFPVDGPTDVEANGRFDINPEGRITFRVRGAPYVWQVLETSGLLSMFRSDPALKGEYVIDLRLLEHAPYTRPVITVTSGRRPETAPAPRAGR
jgi:copper chaperone CopZ